MSTRAFEQDSGPLRAGLLNNAGALMALASRCDAMCLTTGIQLGNAIPGLSDLSNQFASLSAMLLDADGTNPAKSLETVAADITAIGTALAAERDALGALITINGVLSQRIIGLAEHVRFLAAVVSNVKIEIATIDESEHRLEGFADNLKQLATKSEATVGAFQDTHQRLIKQLQRTATAQSTFVTSHGAKFLAASKEISASLGAVSIRRSTVAATAAEIGGITQRIGAKIAECVVGLQVGDSTRQRLEHAGEALTIAADIVAGIDPDGLADAQIGRQPAHREHIAARIGALQIIQTSEATIEFAAEVQKIERLLRQITDASLKLNDRSRALVTSPDDGSRSFLADLEAKLAFAGELIEECGKSRKLVDDTAEQVVASVADLQALAQNVAAMATDMMIIGTNAVVTSYRLGTKGIPLSVIAQHLRNHAVHVTDAVKLVRPALDKVRDAARQFTTARKGQDASSMGGLATRITEALTAFRSGDIAVAEVHDRLDAEAASVAGVLLQATEALRGIDDIKAQLGQVTEAIAAAASDTDHIAEESGASPDPALSLAIDPLLRKRYTMGSERVIHDRFFAHDVSAAANLQPAADASLWL